APPCATPFTVRLYGSHARSRRGQVQSSNHRCSSAVHYNPRVQRLVLVCVGGAVGTGLRYLAAIVAARWLGSDFPWGTLVVNLVGAFLIGLVQQLAAVPVLSE